MNIENFLNFFGGNGGKQGNAFKIDELSKRRHAEFVERANVKLKDKERSKEVVAEAFEAANKIAEK